MYGVAIPWFQKLERLALVLLLNLGNILGIPINIHSSVKETLHTMP